MQLYLKRVKQYVTHEELLEVLKSQKLTLEYIALLLQKVDKLV